MNQITNLLQFCHQYCLKFLSKFEQSFGSQQLDPANSKKLNKQQMAFKGINWGKLNMDQQGISLTSLGSNGGTILNINYSKITNSTVNKNDIIIETTNQELNKDDCMCEIRFHVESVNNPNKEGEQMDDQNKPQGQDDEQVNAPNNKVNPAAIAIHKEIVEKGKLGEFVGESIISLNDINLAVPRGKYSVDFYQKNLRFHGITYSYNIDYRNISKGFILPMANESQICLVLQLNKPIYQGQTVYPYIVIQIKKQTEVQVKSKVKPEQQKQKRFQSLKPEYKGHLFEVFGDIIRTIADIQLILPGTQFKSKSGQSCIKCSVKTHVGYLYPLKKSLIFITKPVTYFKIEDIKKVEFLRMTSNTKQFDLKITLQSEKKSIQYANIERIQLQVLVDYFKSREIKVEMEDTNLGNQIIPDVDDDQSDDEDFEGGQQDDDSSSSEDQEGDEQSQSKQQKQTKKDKPNQDNKMKQE